jgi:hypothetical protein
VSHACKLRRFGTAQSPTALYSGVVESCPRTVFTAQIEGVVSARASPCSFHLFCLLLLFCMHRFFCFAHLFFCSLIYLSCT